MRIYRTAVGVSAFLLGALPALPRAADERTTPPGFVARTADGADVKGELRELRPDWSVRLGDGDGGRVKGADLLGLRQDGRPLPPPPADGFLLLFNGDRIPAEAPRVDGERLRFRSPDLAGGKEVDLPLAALAVYWRTAPDAAGRSKSQTISTIRDQPQA